MKRKSLYWQLPLLLLLIVGTWYVARENRQASAVVPFQTDHGLVFGTVYNITYESEQNLQADIEQALGKVDAEFSMFNEKSTVAAINRGEAPQRSAMFNEVLQLAKQVNGDTDGAFDITVAPLVNAWGFGFKHEQMPTPQQVDSLLKIRSQLDFSAIAKGYGCDIAARVFNDRGITNYMVEIGGEVVTRGHNPKGQQWRIGITKPIEDSLSTNNSELQAVMAVNDMAMATSGNYRKFYYKDNRRYAHAIDARPGYPVRQDLRRATVSAPPRAVADAYATAFMVLGMQKAKEVLARHPDMKAYFIYTDDKGDYAVWHSPELNIE